MMLGQQMQPQGASLAIIAHGANDLKDVETFGKQDPYLQFSLDFHQPKSFQKTFVHKNAGKNPVWNQSFNVPLHGESDLFIEIMDEETTADAIIAFAAIPLAQVLRAQGGYVNGLFDVFTPAGKQHGQVHLSLTAHGMSCVPSPGYGHQQSNPPTRGESYVSELHQKRIKSIKNREAASDVGTAALGGLLAVGAGFLANKLVTDQKKEEQAKKEAAELAAQEQERFEGEKRRLEEDRLALQKQQQDYERQQQQQQQQHQHREEHREERREEHHSRREERREEHHHSHRETHHGARDWDPVGTYAAGDRVRYHGRDYMCLQGHTSNPTWEPTQAHSLWRSD